MIFIAKILSLKVSYFFNFVSDDLISKFLTNTQWRLVGRGAGDGAPFLLCRWHRAWRKSLQIVHVRPPRAPPWVNRKAATAVTYQNGLNWISARNSVLWFSVVLPKQQ